MLRSIPAAPARRPGERNLASRAAIALPLAAYAGAIGVLVPYEPALAAAVACAAGLAALLAASRRWHPTDAALVGSLVIAATIGLPRAIQVGPVTAGGLITIVTAFALPLGWLLAPRATVGRIPPPVIPLLVFVGWTVLSFSYHRPTVDGFQNVLVWIAFVGALVSSVAAVRRSPAFLERGIRAVGVASMVSLVLYAGSIADGGFQSNVVVAPREVALFFLLAVGCSLAWYRSTRRRLALLGATLGTALILAGLSREAFATAVVLWGVATLDPTNTRGRIRFALAMLAGVAIVYSAVQYIGPLHRRFYTGDLVHVNLGAFGTSAGTVTLNSEGRGELWATTWNSFLTSPLVGHGAGNSDALITRIYGSVDGHPHNDYLRLLNDYGIIGLGLWAWAYLALLRATSRAWRLAVAMGARRAELFHLSATLALITLGLTMITDNVMIYLYIMAPVGILVGMSLSAASSSQRLRGADGGTA